MRINRWLMTEESRGNLWMVTTRPSHRLTNIDICLKIELSCGYLKSANQLLNDIYRLLHIFCPGRNGFFNEQVTSYTPQGDHDFTFHPTPTEGPLEASLVVKQPLTLVRIEPATPDDKVSPLFIATPRPV